MNQQYLKIEKMILQNDFVTAQKMLLKYVEHLSKKQVKALEALMIKQQKENIQKIRQQKKALHEFKFYKLRFCLALFFAICGCILSIAIKLAILNVSTELQIALPAVLLSIFFGLLAMNYGLMPNENPKNKIYLIVISAFFAIITVITGWEEAIGWIQKFL